MKDTKHTYGVNAATAKNTFTKTGYTFKCWRVRKSNGAWSCVKKDKNGNITEWKDFTDLNQAQKEGFTPAEYANGAQIAKTVNGQNDYATFYAQWTPNTYVIRYNANGGSGSMKETKHTYGVNSATSKNAFTRPGAAFQYWFVQLQNGEWICSKKDSTGNLLWKNFKDLNLARKEGFAQHPYADGAQISNLVTAQNGYATFYAQWEIREIAMMRLYNPNSGEHFYTADTNEKNFLIGQGWKDEGLGWKAPKSSSTPVYRLYNANAGDHHYTISVNEKNALIKAGWKDEGIGWYSDDAKGKALYRQYNPNAKAGSHNYTTDKNENDFLVNQAGWRDEGIGWYGLK